MEERPADPPTAPIGAYIKELATSRELPKFAVSLCALRYHESGPLLRAALERAADGTLIDREDERLFFRALFIIGGCRDPSGFAPLLRLLRRSQDQVEYLLGDANPGYLPRLATGMYDGDADALFEAIADLRLDEFARDSLLGAATFLTWAGRIDRDRTIAFVRRFDAERLAPDQDLTWYGWLQAVALLGLRDMEPAVMAAWDRGSIPPKMLERHEFIEDLERAERAPEDIQRFRDAFLGYIDDVVEALDDWILAEEDDDDEFFDTGDFDDPLPMAVDERSPLTLPGQPVINPWRHVGRNDPCPCGSGRKAKRCCLAA
jgi:hypothetical protein